MSCSIVRDLLSERLDAPLSAANERIASEHLAACAECRDLDLRLADLVDDLALLSAVETPADLTERILARVPAPPAVGSFGPPRRAAHELGRVAGWAAVMLTASLALLGRDVAGQLADNLAPVLAQAKQEAAFSRASGTSLLARLDERGEAGLARVKAGLRGATE